MAIETGAIYCDDNLEANGPGVWSSVGLETLTYLVGIHRCGDPKDFLFEIPESLP